jgi:hypothetical protein
MAEKTSCVLAFAALIAFSAGCDHDTTPTIPASSPVTPPATASAPAPTPPPSDAVAVEAAYRGFWPLLATFDRRIPQREWRAALGQAMADPQVSQAIAVALQQQRTGIVAYGVPRPRAPRVTLRPPGAATVADCADFSHYGQADARTGQRRTVGVARNPLSVSLVRGADGRWRVTRVTYPGGAC